MKISRGVPVAESPMRLLYCTAEQWPTFRPDVLALFGKYLPRLGIASDLVTEQDIGTPDADVPPWGGGRAVLCRVPRHRAGQYVVKFWHNLSTLVAFDRTRYDAIQVRDMSVTALAGLAIARLRGVPFFYWLSFPHSEDQVARARKRGPGAGMRYWFPLIQGLFGQWVLYRLVLPRADHVFVQSIQMQHDVAARRIPWERMTAVPMGVDIEAAATGVVAPATDARLQNRRVLVYLGTLDPLRQIEVLFAMLVQVRQHVPNALLVLVGDTSDAGHRNWLQSEAQRLGVANCVIFTGWLPSIQAWAYVRAAEIGLSPFPRSFLLDSASPTKAIEYLALGLPVVANDNPDQAEVIGESGAGRCVPLEPESFAQAVIELLQDASLRREMGKRGRTYVLGRRSYGHIAARVAERYRALCDGKRAHS